MMRLQLALNVQNLDEAIRYYGKLFDAKPHKRRAGYANFAIEHPALKLVLFENPEAGERLNHLGVEVLDQDELDAAAERLSAAGILHQEQSETNCCHATQNKFLSNEPQGLVWEWYRIVDDNPAEVLAGDEVTCCGQGRSTTETCCA